jgi:hypothetical protein
MTWGTSRPPSEGLGNLGAIGGITHWLRDRKLAGDRRAGSYPRAQLVRQRQEFLRRSWKVLLLPLLGAAALCPLVVFLPSWAQGFAIGVVLASAIWGSVLLVFALSGVAPLLMGQWAEQQAAYQLRRLRRKGWHLANHALLSSVSRGDIDHLLVGPGGAVVVETKYCGAGWADSFAQQRVEEEVAKLKKRENFVAKMVTRDIPRSHVRSALVLMGGTLPTDPIETKSNSRASPAEKNRPQTCRPGPRPGMIEHMFPQKRGRLAGSGRPRR